MRRLTVAVAVLLAGRVALAVEPFDHVVVVSVDGLRSDALLAAPRASVEAFHRMMRGSSTLNARTDPDATVTLPNHTGMLTGRLMLGPGGHGWLTNALDRDTPTLHAVSREYVAGMFDVAHDRGVHTALFVAKLKLSLYDVSWNETNGWPDETGDDDGTDKIDVFGYIGATDDGTPEGNPLDSARLLTTRLLRTLQAGHARTLSFIHYRETDAVGHTRGWDLTVDSPYLQTVAAIDTQLGRILDLIEGDERLRGRTAVILTSDHGGGAPHTHHSRTDMWVNYIIPFLVWTGDDAPGGELYELNASTRADPGLRQPPADAARPPVRNADAGNLALSLLGLPPIPGATVNAAHDLVITESAAPADTTPAP